ncbi:Vps54-domain-containing protein [Myriangium duriaei CBS 260.36]|uniref:Vacuolar protein sorting-associated protein 54 n=1 Tax=Myriangium duriaei CBS 260.36 TaxID=1168546 RepID=A0A9P4J0Q7_9PEZI|nr:Vps54-domain-containing protein [Myriangium duriaei CBS 260.36]
MSSNRRSFDSLDQALSPTSSTHASYPFPRQDPNPRAYASGRTSSNRRTSNASVSSFGSTTNSIGGTLDIRPLRADNSVKELSHNAISNLLQPPIVRTGLLPHSANVTPGYKAPSTRDIPPVTLTNIPHVDPSAFKDYLTRVTPLFDTISRRREEAERASKAEAGDEAASTPGTPVPGTPVLDKFKRPGISRQGSTATLSPVIEASQQRRRSSGNIRRKANEPSPLSTVPNVYFDEDFHLENPRTFDVVSERAEIVRPAPGTPGEEHGSNGTALPPRKALATNAILQEKLSWYMDTVEVHLINSISTASTSFFAALGSLRDLQREAEESAAQIQKLRSDLVELDRGMALGGLEISQMRHRRRNIGRLCKATEQVHRIIDQVVKCEELVDEGNYEAAADGIEATDNLICGRPDTTVVITTEQEPPPQDTELFDLRELKVLQSLTNGVQDLHVRIGRGFEARFTGTLMRDLRTHVESVPTNDVIRRWATSSQRRGEPKLFQGPPRYLEISREFRQTLSSNLEGLDRAGFTSQAADAFRAAITKEIKALIRKHLPSSNDEDAESVTSVATRGSRSVSQQEKSAILARNLRALDEQDAETLVVGVCTGVSEALRRLGIQIKVLLDLTSSSDGRRSRATSPEPMASPGMTSPGQPPRQSIDGHLRVPNGLTSPPPVTSPLHSPLASPRVRDELAQALDMSSLLGQAIDVAQIQITRVLKVRAEQTHKLPLERFVRYCTILRLFADECEAISGNPVQSLKNILNTQLGAFVAHMAETESQRIAQKLESDPWEAQDFQVADQSLLSQILDGMNSDPQSWTKGARVWEDCSTDIANGQPVANGVTTPLAPADSKPSKSQAKPAYIDETKFVLVQAGSALLPTLDEFLTLIASVPGVSATAVPALMEVLRTFNSRSSQLILGAGATRVSGLKNITTKHLALSSQALSFVIALMPYMREAVRRHVGGRTEILGEFDRTKRLFQDHQMGIHDKLVEIMTARARAHLSAMKKIEFDKADTDGPSPYMETLTKETGTLYRVLNRHLQEGDVVGIMMQIARSYSDVWLKGFSEVTVTTKQGKARLFKDIELFDSRLSKIDGFADIAKALLDGVKGRTIEEKKKPAIEEKKPAIEGKKPVIEEKKPATEEKTPATEEKKPATEEKKPVIEEAKPTAAENEAVADEEKPAPQETSPAPEQNLNVVEEKEEAKVKPDEPAAPAEKEENEPEKEAQGEASK